MSHRIVKIAKQLNRPIKELVDLLKHHGIDIQLKPTARISDEMMDLLLQHYSASPINKPSNILDTRISVSINRNPKTSDMPSKSLTIRDGFYQILLKKLKFKDGLIYIPFDNPSLDVLSYKPNDVFIYNILKSKYSTSNEFLSVKVSDRKIAKIDSVESLSIKLKISKPQRIIVEKIKSKKDKEKVKPTELKPHNQKRIKFLPKPAPEPKFTKQQKSLPVRNVILKANLVDIATYYSVFQTEIIKYLNTIEPKKVYSFSSKLTEKEAKNVQAHFTQIIRKSNPSFSYSKIEWIDFEPESIIEPTSNQSFKPDAITKTNEHSQTLSLKSSFEEIKFDFELKTDKFTTSVSVISYPGLGNFHTYFTDSQAVDICSKMSSSFPRARAADFVSPKNNNKELTRYEIHYMANKALHIFGGKILTLLSDLRKLKFKTKSAFEVRTYRTVRPDFPFLHFNVGGNVVNVAFFTREHHKIKNKFTANSIIYSSKYDRIGFIDELGRVKLELKSFRPQLSLFINKIEDKNYQIYSGVETGVCEICKLPLSHPNSLLFGIGPVCAKKLNIDLRSMNL